MSLILTTDQSIPAPGHHPLFPKSKRVHRSEVSFKDHTTRQFFNSSSTTLHPADTPFSLRSRALHLTQLHLHSSLPETLASQCQEFTYRHHFNNRSTSHTMARHSRANRSGSSWSPVLILLCLLICPLALLGHANAQEGEQEPLGTDSAKHDLGDVIGIDLGTTYCKQHL